MHVEKTIRALLAAALVRVELTSSTDLTLGSRAGIALSDHDCGTFKPAGPHGLPLAAVLVLARGLSQVDREHCMHAWIVDRDRARAVLSALEPYLLRAYAKGIWS